MYHRTIVIYALVFLALLVAWYIYFSTAEGEEQPLPPSAYDARIAELDRAAIETAYQNQITHLFENWMKDDTGQPKRAVTGAIKARKAFVGAMSAVDRKTPLPTPRPTP